MAPGGLEVTAATGVGTSSPGSVPEKASDKMRVRLRSEIERLPMEELPFSADATN